MEEHGDVGLYTGQRLSDIAHLQWKSTDLVQGVIHLVTRKTGGYLTIRSRRRFGPISERFRRSESRAIYLHPRAAASIKRTNKATTLSNQFTKILADVGFRKAAPHLKTANGRSGKRQASELSFHSLRHTAVTMLKEAGIPQAVVMELVGHESQAISQQYTRVGGEALKAAADALPSLQ